MNSRLRAFTMVELLVALMLTALLTAALSLMIGQAARDRRAMQEQVQTPAWSHAAVNLLERDLQHARWWAAGQDRLVLIGLDNDHRPTRTEYRWREGEATTSWSRQQTPLDSMPGLRRERHERVVAMGLSGLTVGPHLFGAAPKDLEQSQANTGETSRISTGASVVIEGNRYPLRSLPEQITIRLEGHDNPQSTIERQVLLH